MNDLVVNSVVQSPDSSIHLPQNCPSENVAVYSMSIDFPNDECLDDLEAAVFAVILHEASDALEVLRGTLEMGVKPEKKVDMDLPSRRIMRKKNSYCENDEKKMFFGEDAGFEPTVFSVRDKLLRNRDLAYNVFCKIACELERKGIFNCLRDEVSKIVESQEKKCNLEVNLKIWSDLTVKLRKLQETLEEEFLIKKKEYTEELNKVSKDIDSSYCANVEKLDYVMRWEAAKLEQQNLRLSLQEEEVLNQIKELEKIRSIDAKVLEELQFYEKSVISSFEQEIVSWSTRYNDELERRQMETTELEEKIEALKEFLENSHELQKERQEVIDKDLEEKKKVNDEIEYWRSIHEAATIVQSIWRGYMVRHRLGRFADLGYRKKKSKKKSKNKPKKNKSKKSKK